MKPKTGLRMSIKPNFFFFKKRHKLPTSVKRMATLIEVLQMLKRVRSHRNSQSLLVGVHNATATLEDSLAVSYKTNILLPDDPTIKLLSIYPKELKTYAHTSILFLAALFLIAKTWKQPRCPSVADR